MLTFALRWWGQGSHVFLISSLAVAVVPASGPPHPSESLLEVHDSGTHMSELVLISSHCRYQDQEVELSLGRAQ